MKPSYTQRALFILPLLVYALGTTVAPTGAAGSSLDWHGAEYLGLVEDLGALNPDSVDFVVTRSRSAERIHATSLREVQERSRSLGAHILNTYGRSLAVGERARRLVAQLNAVAWRSAQLTGEQLSFDEELERLFELPAEQIDRPRPFDSALTLAQLDRLLTGDDTLSQRLAAYQGRFIVPRGRLQTVVTLAIEVCRNQTRRLMRLPEGEGVIVEYVAGRPWSGYSVYRGGYQSVMQVNREVPLTVGQVLNLACHEGYPGHHVYNSLRDQRFVRERGWSEMDGLPLFSPAGFRAEAAASAGAAIVFGADERVEIFERSLFQAAGLDPREAARYVRVNELVDSLGDETTAVVVDYLTGIQPAPDAARVLQQRALMEHPEALLAYLDRYRGYALAYTWGRDRLLAGFDRGGFSDRSEFLSRLMTSSEWDLGR